KEVVSLIKGLSYFDSKKLQEILVFTKLYHDKADISSLDDNLIRQYESIKESPEKWKDIVAHGYLDIYLWLCEKNIINCKNIRNKALIIASENGKLEMVKYLIKEGANVHFYDDEAIMIAAQNGHLETVKYLIDKGAKIHAGNESPLRFAS